VATATQFIVHLLIRHSRFYFGETQSLVNLQDAVHARADIDNETAWPERAFESETTIFTGADAVQRHAILVGEAHDRLHVRRRGWIHYATRLSVSAGQQVAAVPRDGFFRGINRGLTEGVAQGGKKGRGYLRHWDCFLFARISSPSPPGRGNLGEYRRYSLPICRSTAA
jgi:hypothetical protein